MLGVEKGVGAIVMFWRSNHFAIREDAKGDCCVNYGSRVNEVVNDVLFRQVQRRMRPEGGQRGVSVLKKTEESKIHRTPQPAISE